VGQLRARRLGGARFRRQHPIGPYILDLYCEAARLAVEVDGQGHDHPDQLRHDERRTDWLARRGIEVWRIPARDVLENLDGVLEGLHQRVCVRPPPPLRGPPPIGGGCLNPRIPAPKPSQNQRPALIPPPFHPRARKHPHPVWRPPPGARP